MSRYDPVWVRSHYDAYGVKEWERWDLSPVEQVKFRVHVHYLERFLRPEMRVLEAGAGAGRFTRELHRLGCRTTVADISPVQLELNRRNADEHGYADGVEQWVECDICDLSEEFSDAEFDAVVCYGGPLSYLFERASDGLRELLSVTRPGGPVLLSVMSLWVTVHSALSSVFEIALPVNRCIVRSGDLTPESDGGSSHYCHMFRADELADLIASCGAEQRAMSASNCLSTSWAEDLETVRDDSERWGYLLELELEACRQLGCLDMGTHLIAVAACPDLQPGG